MSCYKSSKKPAKTNDQTISIDQLEKLARESDYREGYLVLVKGDGFRIGLIARIDQANDIYHSIEFLVRVLEQNHPINPHHIEKFKILTEELIDRGYILTSQDDGWIYAESIINVDSIDDEKGFVLALLDRYRRPR